MIKKSTVILVLSLSLNGLWANDGVFYASGNTLFPFEETRIELKKEILILNSGISDKKYESDPLDVNVYFEFYNPDDDVEKLIGFVTPPASGGISDLERIHPQITDFTVIVNGEMIKYQVMRFDSTGFKSSTTKINGYDFVYFFKIKFKKGINIIKHSYSYKGSVQADIERPGPNYHYRLTTGKKWANKKIDSFELYINVGNDKYFTVPATFTEGSSIDWQIIGAGKIGTINPDNPKEKFVAVKSGFVYLKAIDFKPEVDLTISTVVPKSEMKQFINFFYPGYSDNQTELSDLSDSDLRLLRNSIFAFHGYQFKSQELIKYFSSYDWYLPVQILRLKI